MSIHSRPAMSIQERRVRRTKFEPAMARRYLQRRIDFLRRGAAGYHHHSVIDGVWALRFVRGIRVLATNKSLFAHRI